METITVPLTTRELASATDALRPPVTVDNDFGHVDKGVVHINIDEQCEWINNADHPVTIVFDHGSPFEKKDPIEVQSHGGRNGSGRPTARGAHKYTVIGSMGNNDPTVIIDG